MVTAPRFLTKNLKLKIQNFVSCAQGRNSLRVKIPLEVGRDFREFNGRCNFGKFFRRVENFVHLLEIIRIVRAQKNCPAGREHATRERGKSFVDKTMMTMFFLRPRIRKINVQRSGSVGRNQILQQISRLDADAAQIF